MNDLHMAVAVDRIHKALFGTLQRLSTTFDDRDFNLYVHGVSYCNAMGAKGRVDSIKATMSIAFEWDNHHMLEYTFANSDVDGNKYFFEITPLWATKRMEKAFVGRIHEILQQRRETSSK